MYDLAVQVHSFSVDQIREGGVCVFDILPALKGEDSSALE
jgi:hypothetical protein